ncbi:hypothetical protein KEM56_000605 [Ascosphaera pollenicola]|nr:hypothetical protein KEM56_000605 [Ascosphaera pollenicola]
MGSQTSQGNDNEQRDSPAATSAVTAQQEVPAPEEKQAGNDREQQPERDEEPPEPPLPDQSVPEEDDGWAPVWDDAAQQYYFYNRFTGLSQWENPRVPGSGATTITSATAAAIPDAAPPQPPIAGGYNPAIHGDYDPTAPYAQQYNKDGEEGGIAHLADPSLIYTATGTFNRFTGQWQAADFGPDRFRAESRRKRQLDAFFDVDAAANSHDGRSLRAERSAKKLSKKELKEFREKRRERKEEKRRAWLRD